MDILRDKELYEKSVVKDYLTTAGDGKKNEMEAGEWADGTNYKNVPFYSGSYFFFNLYILFCSGFDLDKLCKQ